jgi:hypothetical protein
MDRLALPGPLCAMSAEQTITIIPGRTLENPVTGERSTFTDTAASTG